MTALSWNRHDSFERMLLEENDAMESDSIEEESLSLVQRKAGSESSKADLLLDDGDGVRKWNLT